nr:hypothetical protein [Tanacetum cinerariifolium]
MFIQLTRHDQSQEKKENERSSDSGVCGSLLPFVSSVSGPCKPPLSGGYRSPQSNYSVGGKVVVLAFGNSSGPMVLDFKNCVTRSVGSYSVRDQCRDYFRQCGILCSPRQCSSRGISGTRRCTPVSLPTDKNGRGANVRWGQSQSQTDTGFTGSYIDIGDCEWVCEYCSATFWYGEWVKETATFKAPLS